MFLKRIQDNILYKSRLILIIAIVILLLTEFKVAFANIEIERFPVKKFVYIHPQFTEVKYLDWVHGDWSRDYEIRVLVKKDGKWGIFLKKARVLVKPQFDEIEQLSTGFKVKKNEKWGFIDNTVKVLVEPVFDDVYDIYNGLLKIKVGNKFGFVNENGKIEIEPKFEDAKYFIGNMAPVKQNGKWGIIDKTGRFIAEPMYDECVIPNLPPYDKIIIISKDEKYGYVFSCWDYSCSATV